MGWPASTRAISVESSNTTQTTERIYHSTQRPDLQLMRYGSVTKL